MKHWAPFALAPIAVLASAAQATVYLTIEQAQQALFPGSPLQKISVVLNEAQRKAIAARSGVRVRVADLNVWKAADGGYFIVDEVLGKHEYITYAVALTPAGAVRQIDIMEYRENYGYQIRNADWRAQFAGKTSSAPLKLDEDIKNISGATLSCRHIADGIKRLLATYDAALK